MAVEERRDAARHVTQAVRHRMPTQRGVVTSVAMAIVAGFGVLLWYVYDLGFQRGTDGIVPLIKAARGPVKVKPEKPGGMEVPNQDKLVYGLLTKDSPPDVVERLLPPPETPVPKPAPPAPQPVVTPPEKTAPTKPLTVPDVRPAAGPPAATMAGPAAPKPEAPAPPAKQAAAPRVVTPQGVAAPATSFRVQIASVRTAAAAAKGWKRLSSQHSDLLKGLEPTIVRADLGHRGVFHRLQAGPVPSREAAAGLCAKLKSRRVGCLVVRP